ncbi:MAG: hypothetical protein HWN70_13075 [Desulfobacterales bacterium]|nr:hypothetical protein [Desulfobacterales bacterium]
MGDKREMASPELATGGLVGDGAKKEFNEKAPVRNRFFQKKGCGHKKFGNGLDNSGNVFIFFSKFI